MNVFETMLKAQRERTIIPAFNIPYLPMVKPVINAIIDEDSVGMVQVARLEWEKFEAKSLEAVAKEYFKYCNENYTLLHLDHVPVIDEDQKTVDFMPIFERAVKAGYQSVMIDGSRLPLLENIKATKEASGFAHDHGVACEAELGAVAGHEEKGIGIPYEELFETKKGFTKLEEAERFAKESGCDWLSVAVGSVHGAIAENVRKQKKPEAKLDIKHISDLKEAANGMPLVLHGGSGINQSYILKAIENGITKINVGTEIRQAYEFALDEKNDASFAEEAVYVKTRDVIKNFLCISGSRQKLNK